MENRRIRGQLQDRLSSLPDEVLVNILSRLRLKIAVGTTVLSRRWRYLWTHIDSLDVSFTDFKAINQVAKIMNRVLLELDSPKIRKFQITSEKCDVYDCPEIKGIENDVFINDWFNKICARGVEEIQIIQPHSKLPRFPKSLFKTSSLVALELSPGRFLEGIPYSDDYSLPRLKKLSIKAMRTSELELIQKLIYSSPSLEDLSLDFSSSTNRTLDITICARNLRRFFIGKDFNGKVVIDALGLEYLKLRTYRDVSKFLMECNTVKLLEADLETYNTHLNLMSLLHEVILEVSTLAIKPIIFGDPMKFPYLTRLTLDQQHLVPILDVEDLLLFLSGCPLLEILVCRCTHFYVDRIDIYQESTAPQCLLTRVKRIEFNTDICDPTSELMEYLLCNARVLELLVFKRASSRSTEDDQSDSFEEQMFCNKLCGYQRSSPRCQIEFLGHYYFY